MKFFIGTHPMLNKTDEEPGHPFAETHLDPYPMDTRLRADGFVIALRPATGLNRWRRDGEEYAETEAVWIYYHQKLARERGAK